MQQQFNQIKKAFFSLLFFALFLTVNAQENVEPEMRGNIYRPHAQRMMEADTSTVIDSISFLTDEVQDSIDLREQYIQDSIAVRMQFVQDSILAREIFVRDSLIRRQQILDSLIFLKAELPGLLTTVIKTMKDDIILKFSDINIIGDSILTDYNYTMLPFKFNDPYQPWVGKINLSNKPAIIEIDTINKKILNVQASGINQGFDYSSGEGVLILKGQGMFANKYSKNYYKKPIDSVFYNSEGEVIKVKRYYQLYQATPDYQLGSFLINYLYQVKQFDYVGAELSKYEIIKFCDRWAKTDQVKVCNIAKYTLSKQGFSYVVKRENDPVNVYSDGTFTYEFDNLNSLKTVSFSNFKNTENWKTFIEQNTDGNVSRYVYQNGGVVNQTLLVHYYLDEPRAKNKVEMVTCTFEDDGISYYQRNNTTGKARVRDKFTGEWGPWE